MRSLYKPCIAWKETIKSIFFWYDYFFIWSILHNTHMSVTLNSAVKSNLIVSEKFRQFYICHATLKSYSNEEHCRGLYPSWTVIQKVLAKISSWLNYFSINLSTADRCAPVIPHNFLTLQQHCRNTSENAKPSDVLLKFSANVKSYLCEF